MTATAEQLDAFYADLERLAAAWIAIRKRDQQAAAAFLRRALDEGIDAVGPELAPPRSLPGYQRRRVEVALIRAAGAVHEAGYLEHYVPEVEPGTDAIDHYCRRGWRAQANPSLEFDTWWYRHQYLGLEQRSVNPLVHYLLKGRHEGALPLMPQHAELPPTPAAAPGSPPRRVCLFAAYDIDGVVDDYVVAYLRDLSRFADVFYLADGFIPDDELAKLAPYTRGAWSRPHGAYDFGSLSILAGELVGWETIETYDELVFANDSAFLLRPLDEVFARMDAQDCDWWGLQATKRDFERPDGRSERLPDAAVRAMVGRPQWHQVNQLHVSSYLLVLRRPALLEPEVRRLLAEVRPEKMKSQVILKYEVGLSRVLLAAGHRFATFVEGLYPYHPLYTSDFFELAADGFPLLKRNFIAENARNAPGLSRWKERVLEAVPEADVEMFERNLLRVAADDRLQRSFSVERGADGTLVTADQLSDDAVAALDRSTPTYDHWWAFPVCAYDHTFAGNERAVFEQVRDDPSIKKIILTRSRRIEVSGENVVVLPLTSPEGQAHAVRSRFVFIKHAPTVNVPYPLDPDQHDFVNLWHGIPLKRFGMASVDASTNDKVVAEHLGCRSVVTSSAIDTLAMTAAFHPLTREHMWQTGLPRNDFVVRATADLPPDLAAQRTRLLDELDGRRLVMFLPTFKKDQADAYYHFTASDLAWLRDWSVRHHAVIGLREHMADQARVYSSLLGPLDPVNLSSRRYPDLEVLYGAADALVSDYSSCLVDFMLTGKPVVSFAYDLDRYANEERGLFYDLDQVLPGPVARDFGQLASALDGVFVPRTPEQDEEYDWKRRIFFEHLDDGNARRVVTRVRELAVREPSRP
jgi:CDP-glycerol glycerophosphotransferase (TagB/SpsB family)